MKKIPSLLAAGLLLGATSVALQAQTIIQTGGTSDWTIQYDLNSGTFHTVFRAKPNTVWNSDDGQVLANNGLPGAEAANDYLYDTLTVRLNGQAVETANGREYFVSAVGSTPTHPDLGFRMRLGHAFDNFSLNLNVAASTLPGDVAILVSDGLGGYTFRLETAENNFGSSLWLPQGHSHWHWGFTQQGSYSLVFDMSGDLTGGGTAFGTTTVNFEVIPEPSTIAALLGLAVFGAVLILRRRRS
jgi:surface-anchored protein